MSRLADAAGMRRHGDGCQRNWNEIPRKREEQQQSGGQAMHASCLNRNPKAGPE
ncbi:MAG: hypothetical protein WB562_01355 [Candidatus Sulfotelmatobacter sp.]